jgi:hypothetical protein
MLAWLLPGEDAVPADGDRNRAVRSSMPAIVSVVADVAHEPDETSSFLLDVSTRLSEAARTGAPLEVILVVRGRIEPVPRKNGHRWRLRTARGHVVTFRPEFVVAFNGAGGDEQPTKPHR